NAEGHSRRCPGGWKHVVVWGLITFTAAAAATIRLFIRPRHIDPAHPRWVLYPQRVGVRVMIRRPCTKLLPQRIDARKSRSLRIVLPYARIVRRALPVKLLINELLPCVDACHCYRCAERLIIRLVNYRTRFIQHHSRRAEMIRDLIFACSRRLRDDRTYIARAVRDVLERIQINSVLPEVTTL